MGDLNDFGRHGLQPDTFMRAVARRRTNGRDLNHCGRNPRRRMIPVRTRDLYTMNWGRKGAFVMIAVVVFWAAMPASVCLLGSHSAPVPDCCGTMAQGCDSPGMGACDSCCQIHGKNPALPPVPPSSIGHSQKLAAVIHQAGLELPAAPGGGYLNALETPPPKFSPGGAFALRI
jgi:hypothetical protein